MSKKNLKCPLSLKPTTVYPPLHVYVVIECPLMVYSLTFCFYNMFIINYINIRCKESLLDFCKNLLPYNFLHILGVSQSFFAQIFNTFKTCFQYNLPLCVSLHVVSSMPKKLPVHCGRMGLDNSANIVSHNFSII